MNGAALDTLGPEVGPSETAAGSPKGETSGSERASESPAVGCRWWQAVPLRGMAAFLYFVPSSFVTALPHSGECDYVALLRVGALAPECAPVLRLNH